MKYEPCNNCGGEVVDGEPHFIPLGTNSVMEIIDQKCKDCGMLIIGKHQKTKIIENQKAHDKLIEIFNE